MISCSEWKEQDDEENRGNEEDRDRVCFWNPVEDMMRPGIFCLADRVTIMPGQGRRVRTVLKRDNKVGVKMDDHTKGLVMAYDQDERTVSMMAEPIPFIGMMSHESLEIQTSVTELNRCDKDVPCMVMNNGTMPITLNKGMRIARATPVFTPEELMKDEDWVKLVKHEGGKDFWKMLLVKMRTGNMI
jgi:hypothetical protein